MKEPHGEYLKLLEELAGKLSQLADIAREKVDSTRKGDLEVLDRCMKREQVLALSLRGIELKRGKLLAEMGLQDVPLNQLYQHYPDDMHRQAKEAVEALQIQFTRYQSAATAARTVMEGALRDIEKMMPENQAPAPGEAPPNMRTDIRA